MTNIYISPANHRKQYAIDGYNEKQQMELLAPLVVEELEKYVGVTAILPKVYAINGQYDGRPHEADVMHADYYIALHSNASGSNPKTGKATGACAFYHINYPRSKEIAAQVVTALNRICPIKSNRAKQPAVYAQDIDVNLGELREPASKGICPALIEVEFHDREDGARWIVENKAQIAKAIVSGISKALNFKLKQVKGDVNGDGEVNSLDAAQVLKYDANLIDLSDEQKVRSDVNGDGEVNSLDAAKILREDAGI